MQYRPLTDTVSTSLLGFGCMRFPTTPDGAIDEPAAQAMIDRAMAAGVTYYDTAYPYHEGQSEPFVGRALAKYDRASFLLASKLPCWDVHSREDAVRIFEDQLRRLDTPYIDCYLLHSLGRETWERMKALDIPALCRQWQQEGKIRFLGFSFHDAYAVFEDILCSQDWDFCQIQLNYMDTEEQAGSKGLALARRRGVPVVIMEPVKGGMLASLPADVSAPLRALRPDDSDARWALRWVASQPGVAVVLSGMSNAAQLEDNLDAYSTFSPLTPDESAAVDTAAAAIRARVQNGCTGCRYCMPCPAGVDIPANFRLWNRWHMYGDPGAVWEWNRLGDHQAAACIQCGKCEAACPQHLAIRSDLTRVQSEMGDLAHAR